MESIDKTFDVESDLFGLVRCSQGIVHEECSNEVRHESHEAHAVLRNPSRLWKCLYLAEAQLQISNFVEDGIGKIMEFLFLLVLCEDHHDYFQHIGNHSMTNAVHG